MSASPDPGIVLPMESIRHTGRLVLLTKPTAVELFGIAVRVRMLSLMRRMRSSTFLVNGSCTLVLVRETTSQSV